MLRLFTLLITAFSMCSSALFTLVNRRGQPAPVGTLGLLLYKGGTVCDDNFDANSAHAVCREMGYDHIGTWNSQGSWSIQSHYNIRLDDVMCDETAEWGGCSYVETHNCQHSEDVFLSCLDDVTDDVTDSMSEAISFKLVNTEGRTILDGEVGLLLYNGGTVCDDMFDNNAANAICRFMGYTGATGFVTRLNFDIATSLDIKLDNVQCTRGSWDSCTFVELSDCTHREDVYLGCDGEIPDTGPEEEEGSEEEEEQVFFIVNGQGEVITDDQLGLLLYKGGTVCDDSFSSNSANAICKLMGYAEALRWVSGTESYSIQNDYEITLDEVQCVRGDWSTCTFSEDHNCRHTEDVFLRCNPHSLIDDNDEEAAMFALVDESGGPVTDEQKGLLLYYGKTVCDDRFDFNAASAICHELGRPGAIGFSSGEFFDTDSLEIGLDNVDCRDMVWANCSYETSHNCQPSENVYLRCSAPTEATLPPVPATDDPESTCPPQESCPPTTCPAPDQIQECAECADCAECPAGYYLQNSTCHQCPEHYYSAEPGATSCIECPGISTSAAGATQCVCRAGTMWVAGRCKHCPDDHAGMEGVCVACPQGSHPINNDNSCSCPEGEYWVWSNTLTGLTGLCVPCTAGTYRTGDMLHCELCPTYSTSPPGAQHCSCEGGSYWREGECWECEGETVSQAGALQCTNCSTARKDDTSCECGDGLVWEWLDQHSGLCAPCFADTYKSGDMTNCASCPSGTSTHAGASHCTCTAGQFWNGTDCTPCADGMASRAGSVHCTICQHAASSADRTTCICSPGSFWVWDSGVGSCVPCRAGSYRNSSTSSCLLCPAGSSSLAGAAQCSCPAGTFWAGGECDACAENSVSAAEATQCTVCELGAEDNSCKCEDGKEWKWEEGVGSCSPCTMNTYKMGDMTRCEACPEASSSEVGAAWCTCTTGTFWSNGNCVTCANNTFYDAVTNTCVECPADSVQVDSHSACSCGAGLSWHPLSRSCKTCPKHHYSREGSAECEKCPLYTVSGRGAEKCTPCPVGQYWLNYTCETCNESGKIGNGVFCLDAYDEQTQELRSAQGNPPNSQNIVFTCIVAILAVTCLVLILLLVARQRKQRIQKQISMSYSVAPLTGGSESEWQDMRNDSMSGPQVPIICALTGADNATGSEENIYMFQQEQNTI